MSAPIVSGKDKPFILLLLVTMSLVLIAGYGVVNGNWDNVDKATSILLPFVTMGFGLYFGKKL